MTRLSLSPISVLKFVLCIALPFGAAQAASAAFLIPNSATPPFGDWSRGDAGSLYAEWDVFAVPFGTPGNAPDAGVFPDGGSPDANSALLVGNNPTGFLVGGNIYSFMAATDFTVTFPGYGNGDGFNTRVAAQIRTRGTTVDLDSLQLAYNDGTSDILADWDFHTELHREHLGVDVGDQIDHLFVFDILGHDPAALALNFAAAGSSMSLDRVAIDTFSTQSPLSLIPEPGTSTLLLIGAAGLGFVHWRRRHVKS
ncbi:MAG: PEP-CTERM sorting domain-containing protein [Pirellulales bacterium]